MWEVAGQGTQDCHTGFKFLKLGYEVCKFVVIQFGGRKRLPFAVTIADETNKE